MVWSVVRVEIGLEQFFMKRMRKGFSVKIDKLHVGNHDLGNLINFTSEFTIREI